MQWFFEKYTGCGNDFILFDNRNGNFPTDDCETIRSLCDRERGIGADGILLLENSSRAHARMRIFNRDGSEAEMCGNGLRCFVKWLDSQNFPQNLLIEVMTGVLKASHLENDICIEMGNPSKIQFNIPFLFENQPLTIHHINIGVPHTLLFVKELDKINLSTIGFYIRNHPSWMPQGTNVTLAQQIGPQKFKMRTYERGVEGETLACGTGATAVALAAAHLHNCSSPIEIQTLSKEILIITFHWQGTSFSEITLTGPAKKILQGEVELSNFK